MPTYEYTAKDRTGGEFSGVFTDACSQAALQEELQRMGYTLISAKKRTRMPTLRGAEQGITRSEVITFCYELAGMYKAGMPLVKTLDALRQNCENTKLNAIIEDVTQKIEAGESMAEAFEKYSNVFSEFFISMVEAGEAGGRLSETLSMAARYLEARYNTQKKIRGAFAYPVVVGLMSMLIVTALVIFVIPVFQKLYRQLNVPLPGPTVVLITISELTRGYWPVILVGLILTLAGGRFLLMLKPVRQRLDSLMLMLPVFGELNRMTLVSQYTRTLSMMLAAGVGIVEAVTLAGKCCPNIKMKEISERLNEKILSGSGLSEPMSAEDIFPPIIIQLASAGEESGTLAEMLEKATDFIDTKIERQVKALILKIEPVMSLIMGLMVGSILLGVYLPMFDYMSHFK